MTEQEIADQLAADFGSCEVRIPVPRSGSHYELWRSEVEGYHGCLDAPVGE